jgi:Flp pilus assembly protein TadG
MCAFLDLNNRSLRDLKEAEMKHNHSSENGQAIVLLAISIVVLLGFTALAIDGGMIFADRRSTQNAADAAALAGALQKSNGHSDADVRLAAENSLRSNGFDPAEMTLTISNVSDFGGYYHLITVELTSITETSFAHLFNAGQIQNHVLAEARVRVSSPALPGTAIIAMGDCYTDGGTLISVMGGGHSGGVLTYNGGMFVNSPEPAGNGHCAINPPESTGNWGIRAFDGHVIYSVGSHNYAGETDISPVPIQTSINGGVPIDDPLGGILGPICTSNGSRSGNVFQPGRYGGPGQPNLGAGELSPGIYCISGDLTYTGNDSLTGDGVLLYFIDGHMSFRGNGAMNITAPNVDNCLGVEGNRTDSCNYKGMVIFSARGNTNTIDLRGNGDVRVTGLVYALDGDFLGKGGGHTADEWVVNGQVIARTVAGDGNGSFVVNYNPSTTYWLPPQLSLER